MKRQRGRGRKPNNPGNRSFESNGPGVKIRGNANQIYEKYLQYGRDAQTSGDRVTAEAFFQHAEHYYRIMAANMPKDRLPNSQDESDNRDDDDNRDEDTNSADDSDSDDQEQDQNQGRNRDRGNNNRGRNRRPQQQPSNSDEVEALNVVDGEGEKPEKIEAEGEEPVRRRRAPRRRKSEDDAQPKGEAQSKDEGSDDDAGLRAMMARSPDPSASSSAEPVES